MLDKLLMCAIDADAWITNTDAWSLKWRDAEMEN